MRCTPVSLTRQVEPGTRYFLLVGGRSVHSAPHNLVCLSIKHGVQRLLNRAKNSSIGRGYKDV